MGDASLPPADGIAAVPWNWLVNTGGQCDLNRSEAQSWRDWYAQLQKAWPKAARSLRRSTMSLNPKLKAAEAQAKAQIRLHPLIAVAIGIVIGVLLRSLF